jgi:hypothetical protein
MFRTVQVWLGHESCDDAEIFGAVEGDERQLEAMKLPF